MRTVTLRVNLKKDQKVDFRRTPHLFLCLLSASVVNDYSVSLLSLSAHRQRLVSVQSILTKPSQAQMRYTSTSSSLEQELHQRQLFEYFLVVSLQKSKAGGHYLPEVTQQFPLKVSPPLMRMTCPYDVLNGLWVTPGPKKQQQTNSQGHDC